MGALSGSPFDRLRAGSRLDLEWRRRQRERERGDAGDRARLGGTSWRAVDLVLLPADPTVLVSPLQPLNLVDDNGRSDARSPIPIRHKISMRPTQQSSLGG